MAELDLLTDLLKSVSRSFYLTLRVLPGAIRPQIGVAYLLARATDTIADTAIVTVEQRLSALDQLRRRVLGTRREPLDFSGMLTKRSEHPSTPAELALLGRIEEALDALNTFDASDRQRIRQVLTTITSGQELDLHRFAQLTPGGAGEPVIPRALEDDSALDDYTYRVAGCVGEFWTKTCRAHLFPTESLDEAALLANAVRFGKGLQLVNILRDLPRDLRLGRCYLPADGLAGLGLSPAELRDPGNESRVRPLYDRWLGLAHDHLAAGWAYTNDLPPYCRRLRLACAWPILIGVKTLVRLRHAPVLDPSRQIKITRPEVRAIIFRSVIAFPFRSAWTALLDTCGRP
jgi:farnesyl-diphosphate farnesyltransferase